MSYSELLSFFEDDVAVKFNGFRQSKFENTPLDSTQMNKLALRTNNPVSFLNYCRSKQSLEYISYLT